MTGLMNLLLLLTFLVNSAVGTYYSSCSTGWIPGPKNHCYFFSKECVPWFQANFICQKRGGHLVSLETKEEIDFVRNQAKIRKSGNFWIGATDYLNEGKYIWWPTRSKVTCSDWAPGQPDNGRRKGQHCALLWNRSAFSWDDGFCHLAKNYICETYPGSDSVCKCAPKE